MGYLYVFVKVSHAKVIRVHFFIIGWSVCSVHGCFGQKVGGGAVWGESEILWGENNEQFWVSVTMVLKPFALEMLRV